MISTKRLIKVTVTWTSIVYAICFAGVAMFSTIRPGFMMYAFHMRGGYAYENVLTLATFISGLVIWNLIAILCVWLFVALWNRIKE